MSARIDRLLALAEKTGHPLIIHDRTRDRDLVVMDVEEYEFLLNDNKYDEMAEFGERDNLDEMSEVNEPTAADFLQTKEPKSEELGELSESEMLYKINRDIALWKSARELEEVRERAEAMAAEDLAVSEATVAEEKPAVLSEPKVSELPAAPARPVAAKRPAGAASAAHSWNRVGEVLEKKGFAGGRPVPPASDSEDFSLQAAAEPLPDEPVFFEEPAE